MEMFSSKEIVQCEKYLAYFCLYCSHSSVSRYKYVSIKTPIIFNEVLMNFILIAILVRDLISLMINNEHVSLMLGDIAFNWRDKSLWNIDVILAALTALGNRFLHYYYSKINHFPMKSFEHDKLIDLSCINNKSKYYLKLLKFHIWNITVFGFLTFFIPLSFNLSLIKLLTFGLFWSILGTLFVLYSTLNLSVNMAYFCLLAYKFKLQLRLENNQIKQLSTKHLPKVLIERQLLRIISRIFKIYKQIKDENKFWSKWLLIEILFMSSMTATFLTNIIFGEFDKFVFILMLIMIALLFIYTMILYMFCILLHNEANRACNILYCLYFCKPKTYYSPIIKMKVNNG